jgi:hypothetical protein
MKKIARVSILMLFAAACGGGDDSNNPDAPPHPDAPQQPDAAGGCTAITVGAQTFDTSDVGLIRFNSDINEDLGQPSAMLFYWFFDDGTGDLSGTHDLSQAPNDNFMTCSHCIIAASFDADGNAVQIWYQTAGSITLTANPISPEPSVRSMIGTLDGVTLSEVTLDPDTGASTLVPGGSCLTLGPSLALNQDDVPDTWTCAPEAYANQDATCDCVCGAPDPDCDGAQTTTNGCTGAEVCVADACALPPPNDTCATGIPLVLGTPVTGTNVAGANDYEVGTDAATCASDGAGGGYLQKGSDVAYTIALTAGQTITATVSGADPTYDPGVYLLGPGIAACSADVTATCVAGADATLEGEDETFTYTATAAGTYYVIVDSFYSPGGALAQGAFTLTVN